MNGINGNSILRHVGQALLVLMACGALATSLNLWRDAASHASFREVHDELEKRDIEYSRVFNKLGADHARIEATLEILMQERLDQKPSRRPSP